MPGTVRAIHVRWCARFGVGTEYSPHTEVGDHQEDVVHTDPESPAEQDAEAQDNGGRHHAKEGAERHPLIDLDRDPNPGVADHAAPDEE
jgi:hypothetical protein